MVAHLIWDQGVVGSNPATPTMNLVEYSLVVTGIKDDAMGVCGYEMGDDYVCCQARGHDHPHVHPEWHPRNYVRDTPIAVVVSGLDFDIVAPSLVDAESALYILVFDYQLTDNWCRGWYKKI